jgi:hypothetical protein
MPEKSDAFPEVRRDISLLTDLSRMSAKMTVIAATVAKNAASRRISNI